MTSLQLQFGGGLESLFAENKHLHVKVAKPSVRTIRDLIEYIRTDLIRDRHHMFISQGSLRPGILVLVNDVDWELLDSHRYILKDGDQISFISTLHGG
ncbi:unnamed protein product [Agarophyton chilense]